MQRFPEVLEFCIRMYLSQGRILTVFRQSFSALVICARIYANYQVARPHHVQASKRLATHNHRIFPPFDFMA